MAKSPIVYEWECPICGITRIGLTHLNRSAIVDEAENALRSHVRHTAGEGHGGAGELPPGFDEVEVVDFVRFKERFGGRAAP